MVEGNFSHFSRGDGRLTPQNSVVVQINNSVFFFFFFGGGGGRGEGEGGEGVRGRGRVTCGVIMVRVGLRANISKTTPFIYLALKKQTRSYTWSSEMLTYSYTALRFLYPFIAGS